MFNLIKTVNFIGITIFFVLITYGCSTQALPVNQKILKQPEATSKSTNLLQAYVWYDGDQKKMVWLNPGLMAEFQGNTPAKRLMLKNSTKASLKLNHHSVRIWEMSSPLTSDTLLNRVDLTDSASRSAYSPVWQDTASTASRMRALPGNIIVYLDSGWSLSEVTVWFESRGLEILKKLEIRPNAYLLKTRSGIEALHKANALYESGEVIAAFPDWWLESVMR